MAPFVKSGDRHTMNSLVKCSVGLWLWKLCFIKKCEKLLASQNLNDLHWQELIIQASLVLVNILIHEEKLPWPSIA